MALVGTGPLQKKRRKHIAWGLRFFHEHAEAAMAVIWALRGTRAFPQPRALLHLAPKPTPSAARFFREYQLGPGGKPAGYGAWLMLGNINIRRTP